MFKIIIRCFTSEVKFQIKPYNLHNLDIGPPTEVSITHDEALKYLEDMYIIRKLETAVNALYKAKAIRGFCHLYSGQEAVAVGINSVLRPQDTAITSYRNHAWSYLLDRDLTGIFAELLGKKRGCSGGKGGSMHLYGPRLYGGNAIVGAQVPVGVGIAFSYKYRNIDAVCVALYGDGAANNGQVYEAFNMAKLWNVPCIFVCENNLYSMGTSTIRSTANTKYYTKGETIPGLKVDGMDVLACREAAKFALAHKGPIILEMETYRFYGHSLSDPGTTYRTREEVQQMRKTRDPINLFKDKLINANLITEEELKQIQNSTKKFVNDANKEAQSSDFTGVEELTFDIYASNIVKEVRNVNPFRMLPHKTTKQGGNFT